MRAFVGLELPPAVSARLDQALIGARSRLPPARWVPPENRHLTLVFLGRLDGSQAERLQAPLAAAFAAEDPLRLSFHGFGVFPERGRARVAWVGLRAGARLGRLHRRVSDACREEGLAIEGRPFVAHLTLARCRPPWPGHKREVWREAGFGVVRALGRHARFDVEQGALFESVPVEGGVRYRVVQSYPLGSETRVTRTAP